MAYTPFFRVQIDVLLDTHTEFLLQSAAVDVPIPRARARRGRPAKLGPAETPKRIRLHCSVASSAPSAPPATKSYVGRRWMCFSSFHLGSPPPTHHPRAAPPEACGTANRWLGVVRGTKVVGKSRARTCRRCLPAPRRFDSNVPRCQKERERIY